jgi:hypothetical protein
LKNKNAGWRVAEHELLLAAWTVGKEHGFAAAQESAQHERETICSLMREKIERLESFARTASDRSRKMKHLDQAEILQEMIVTIMRRYEK